MTLALLPCSAADTGRLKTEVNPGRAGVFVDGKYLGPAANFRIARTYDVAAGDDTESDLGHRHSTLEG